MAYKLNSTIPLTTQSRSPHDRSIGTSQHKIIFSLRSYLTTLNNGGMWPSAPTVLVAVLVVVVAQVTAAEVPLVDTEDGRVSGIVEESVKGRNFFCFYGIPYAQPPLDKLRFKDPKPAPRWKGTRDASVPAAPCLQGDLMDEQVRKETLRGKEDCLYLNVFTPKTQVKEDRLLPVMVWIHGGGFYAGSAQEYLPHILLDQDVVLVAIQYRLGVLGFLSTEDSVMPGNLGLKDQTMALEWVQRNIHVFGGDKTRVTIFGESAGGASVHFHILTPKSEGLFSRAILQSGAALCPWAVNRTPRKITHEVANILGCPTDQGSDSILVCLQGKEAADLALLYQVAREWSILPNVFTPWVDGDYLPDHPAQLMRDGRHTEVDIIAGVTRDEGAFFALVPLREKHLLKALQHNFSMAGPPSLQLVDKSEDPVGVARQLYYHYLGTTHVTEEHAEDFMRLLNDRHFAMCHDLTTAHHARNLHPAKKTFRYELQYKGEFSFGDFLCPSCRQKWVCHADDLFYLFRGGIYLGLPPKDLQRPGDLAVKDIITTLWTNFAATGHPTPDDSLGFTWEPSTADNLQYLSLTPSPSMQPDNRKEIRKFYNSLPIQENFILHPHLVEDRPHEPKDATYSSKIEL